MTVVSQRRASPRAAPPPRPSLSRRPLWPSPSETLTLIREFRLAVRPRPRRLTREDTGASPRQPEPRGASATMPHVRILPLPSVRRSSLSPFRSSIKVETRHHFSILCTGHTTTTSQTHTTLQFEQRSTAGSPPSSPAPARYRSSRPSSPTPLHSTPSYKSWWNRTVIKRMIFFTTCRSKANPAVAGIERDTAAGRRSSVPLLCFSVLKTQRIGMI